MYIRFLTYDACTIFQEVFDYRKSKPDHVIQALFFGKILELLATPSTLVEQFIGENLVMLTFPDGTTPVRTGFDSFNDFHRKQLDSHVCICMYVCVYTGQGVVLLVYN